MDNDFETVPVGTMKDYETLQKMTRWLVNEAYSAIENLEITPEFQLAALACENALLKDDEEQK